MRYIICAINITLLSRILMLLSWMPLGHRVFAQKERQLISRALLFRILKMPGRVAIALIEVPNPGEIESFYMLYPYAWQGLNVLHDNNPTANFWYATLTWPAGAENDHQYVAREFGVIVRRGAIEQLVWIPLQTLINHPTQNPQPLPLTRDILDTEDVIYTLVWDPPQPQTQEEIALVNVVLNGFVELDAFFTQVYIATTFVHRLVEIEELAPEARPTTPEPVYTDTNVTTDDGYVNTLGAHPHDIAATGLHTM